MIKIKTKIYIIIIIIIILLIIFFLPYFGGTIAHPGPPLPPSLSVHVMILNIGTGSIASNAKELTLFHR
jgi:uncharacterized membrane protein